ncbi:hypothetical protein [Shimia sagamensis]|uniref:Uncharacterized protein n=1 Tax=Shimia sagamensis TaxID=1566352 RepID=A0ABY1NTM1_9RHOB|nr:hypothetical protein [Shimia sagamensis]SMP17523.1 hypothetical protein SAMN06265373_103154 [Shimia sagamensis]
MWKLTPILALIATPVLAQNWKTATGDNPFASAALAERLSGQTLIFFDNGQSVFENNGQYQYIYGGGGTWYGHWKVADNSTVCVTFVTGVERCDRIVENGGRLVMQTADGLRFPVRDIEAHS